MIKRIDFFDPHKEKTLEHRNLAKPELDLVARMLTQGIRDYLTVKRKDIEFRRMFDALKQHNPCIKNLLFELDALIEPNYTESKDQDPELQGRTETRKREKDLHALKRAFEQRGTVQKLITQINFDLQNQQQGLALVKNIEQIQRFLLKNKDNLNDQSLKFIIDFIDYNRKDLTDKGGRLYPQEARSWVDSDSEDYGSFIHACNLFNIDPGSLRKKLNQKIALEESEINALIQDLDEVLQEQIDNNTL